MRDVLKNGKKSTTNFSSLSTFSLGAGLAIYLSEAWALDMNFKVAKGGFNDVQVDNISDGRTRDHLHTYLDLDAQSARFTVGVSWWP